MRLIIGCVAGLLAALMADAGPAAAHAIILEAQPTVGATVAGSSVAVDLRFNSRIDHVRSRLWLSAGAREVTIAVAQTAPADRLTGEMRNLEPGDYVLHWQVLAVDGHITRGDIPFHVAAP